MIITHQSDLYALILVLRQHKEQGLPVIPAQAGIQIATLDSRLRGNDETPKSKFDQALDRNEYHVYLLLTAADVRP